MPYFQVVDELMSNPKFRRIQREHPEQALSALGVWTAGGVIAQDLLTDGQVPLVGLREACPNLSEMTLINAASLLVEAELWHVRGHSCEVCPQPEIGSWIFHDWFQLGYSTAVQVRLNRAKRKELKDRRVTDAVWLRDRIGLPDSSGDVKAKCRYCGKVVHRKKRNEWQFDHVDPFRVIGATNVVVACRPCNQRKGQRTPAEAGMKLRPAPRALDESASAVKNSGGVAVVAGPGGVEPAGRSREESDGILSLAGSPHGASPVSTAPATELRAAGMLPHADLAADEVAASNLPPRDSAEKSVRQVRGKSAASSRLSTCARAGQGKGQGSGSGTGQGQGKGQGQGSGSGRRRRGRRRSVPGSDVPPASVSTQPVVSDRVLEPAPVPESPPTPGTGGLVIDPRVVPDSVAPPAEGMGGVAPEPQIAGRFGSPWYGWRGRPPEVDEAFCEVHGQHEPCPDCTREVWVNDRNL